MFSHSFQQRHTFFQTVDGQKYALQIASQVCQQVKTTFAHYGRGEFNASQLKFSPLLESLASHVAVEEEVEITGSVTVFNEE